MFNDLKFAIRSLVKSPGFTVVAVLSLALGIGANTAIFSLVNAILLSSLPVPNPQELRTLQWSGVDPKIPGFIMGHYQRGTSSSGSGTMDLTANSTEVGRRDQCDSFSYPIYRQLRDQCATQADIFGYSVLDETNVRARLEPFTADGLIVTDNFFSGLGVQPFLGQLFKAGDDNGGTAPIVVLSDEFWTREFGRDPGVLGKTVTLNGNAFTVVGVVPREFHGTGLANKTAFYVPMSAQPLLMASWPTTSPDRWWVHLMARVKPGVSAAQLQTALDTAFAPQVQSTMKAPKIELGDGRAGTANDQNHYRGPLMILLSVVGIVILIACANLAGLSLARSAARQHEFAVRAALGSGRWRLIRQSLTESFVLALLGGALGVLFALWGQTVLSQLLAGSVEGLRYDLTLDLTVLGFTFGLSLVTAVLTGLLPALRAGRTDPVAGLKSRNALGAPRLRTGRILVVAQIALSVLLLAGAGLYVRTLVNLVRVNPGFATEQLLLFQLNPRSAGLRGAAATAFFERTQTALEKIPGARAVALTQFKLLAGIMSGGGFVLPSHPELTGEKRPNAHRLNVSETFFATMGIPLVLGRGLTAADTEGAPKVVVVNETFVRTYFPNENPLGQTLQAGRLNGVPFDWQIVGVCRDAKYADIKTDVPPTIYFSYRQNGTGSAYFAVRTSLPPFSIIAAARKAVGAIDPNVPLADITTQEAVRDRGVAPEIMFATLVSALAGLAVLLACIGLYGLLAYNVARRTSEIGIRMALGAQRGDIAHPILREALLLAAAGLVVGVPAALALAQLIKNQLYGVAPTDPFSLTLGAVLLLAVAALAAWLPARRAARVDPMIALRAE
jgi:predicted permease